MENCCVSTVSENLEIIGEISRSSIDYELHRLKIKRACTNPLQFDYNGMRSQSNRSKTTFTNFKLHAQRDTNKILKLFTVTYARLSSPGIILQVPPSCLQTIGDDSISHASYLCLVTHSLLY